MFTELLRRLQPPRNDDLLRNDGVLIQLVNRHREPRSGVAIQCKVTGLLRRLPPPRNDARFSAGPLMISPILMTVSG
jgi:hypothetical protein